MQLLIYGARSLALGVATAMQTLYPEYPLKGFLVTSLQNNPTSLMGLPVWELQEAVAALKIQENMDYHILVAAPDDAHLEISKTLEKFNCHNYTSLTSETREFLMEKYYERSGKFHFLRELIRGAEKCTLNIFMAQFYRDRKLKTQYERPEWVYPLQVGKALTDIRITELTDDSGENISAKNPNYCELTALYWIWKNRLVHTKHEVSEYYGLCHYRRVLDITEDDLYRLGTAEADVILPFPTVHEPNILEHYSRYVSESDWSAMERALEELNPGYAQALSEIFEQKYFYNYNILIAKKQVLADYCAWLFPILFRAEELSIPKGCQRADRYIGYLGENLLTLYFMFHQKDLKIVHTGCFMLT